MRTLISFCSLISLGAVLYACSDDDPAGTGTTTQGPSGSGGMTSSTGAGAQGGGVGGGGAGGCDIDDGQCIFRHDTFGDEQLWTDALRLHELVQGLPPTTALAVGLKVDAAAVPPDVLANADLDDPATTVALLELGAVVGVEATVTNGTVERIGITCALCHSSVDDSVMKGVGARMDGWPNRELDPGLIISLTPGLADYVTGLGLDPAVVGPG
jgi:hypothetical protein